MFGLFKKRYTPKLSISQEDKEWIEFNMLWFIEAFGFQKIKHRPFLIHEQGNTVYNNLQDKNRFEQLYWQLCEQYEINHNDIALKLFDDLKTKEWTTPLVPMGGTNEFSSSFQQVYNPGERRFMIHLEKSALDNPALVVAALARQLARIKLVSKNMMSVNDPAFNQLAELVAIGFGFGIFIANTSLTQSGGWTQRNSSLTDEYLAYINALLCYITQTNIEGIAVHLNTNTHELCRRNYEYLVATKNTSLTPGTIKERETIHDAWQKMDEGFKNRQFDQAIAACNILLNKQYRIADAYNGIGYALLQQKKYREAIEIFTKAIDVNPYYDYPYNNRGYCKLQLGQIEESYSDIHSSYDMNPENSFSHRNLGVYYLLKDDNQKALHHFSEAQRIDPGTEMINFYLGQAYRKLGNEEKAAEYFEKSTAANEYNDSVLS